MESSCRFCATGAAVHGDGAVGNEDFVRLRVLGKGSFGTVMLVRKRGGYDDGELYAMKVTSKNSDEIDDYDDDDDDDDDDDVEFDIEVARAERTALEAVRRKPFLSQMHYAFQTHENLYVVLGYLSGGTLASYLRIFSIDEVRFYVGEVILALGHLHKLGIVHRDIDPENILLDHDGHLVLGDFGLSKQLIINNEMTRTISDHAMGTIDYIAPEIAKLEEHGLPADWWAVGILTHVLLTKKYCFDIDLDDYEKCLENIITKNPNLQPSVPQIAKDFIEQLLEKDQFKRLGSLNDANELKDHPFFAEMNWDRLSNKEYEPPVKPLIRDECQMTDVNLVNAVVDETPCDGGVLKDYDYASPREFEEKREQAVNTTRTKSSCWSNLKEAAEDGDVGPNDFQRVQTLGKGDFGTVLLVRKRGGSDDGKLYAMKTTPKYFNNNNSRKFDIAVAMTERSSLEAVRNKPFLSQMYYAFQTQANVFLVLEYLSGGTLASHLREFNIDEVRFYVGEVILALEHLHEVGIVHRDIDLNNILLDEDGHVVIGDFGFSARLKENNKLTMTKSNEIMGTLDYIAPEIVNLEEHGFPADWWAVGILTHILLTKGPCYYKFPEIEECLEYMKTNDPYIQEEVPEISKDFMEKLLVKDQQKRLGSSNGASELKQHPFFAAMNWVRLANKGYKPPVKPVICNYFKSQVTDVALEDSVADESPCNGLFLPNYAYSYAKEDDRLEDAKSTTPFCFWKMVETLRNLIISSNVCSA